VFGLSVIDLAIAFGVPVLVSAVLSALGVPAYLALTAAVLIGGKAALGQPAHWRAGRRASFVLFCVLLAEIALAGRRWPGHLA
jgi:hypothetical protein